MKIIERIKYWWMMRKYPKALRTYKLPNDIYVIRLKNGKAHYIHIPPDEDNMFPLPANRLQPHRLQSYIYIEYLKMMAEKRKEHQNTIQVDEEKIENKDKDWLDGEEL